MPRTGSTALSFLLARDPGVRYLRSWESATPCPPPATVVGADPRIPQDTPKVLAGSRTHVPADAQGPMECLDLMALDFKSQIFQAFAQIPSYSQWLVDRADFTSTYRYQRRVLKLLAWREPVRPWRLKTQAHVLSLTYLDEAFPDARFVMTHRDPTDVLLSVADVYADIPKAVWAAIAISLATCGGDTLDDAARAVVHEWAILHTNGIVPQRVPASLRAYNRPEDEA